MNTLGRKQRQTRNAYRHIAPGRRPVYTKQDSEKSAKRLAARINKERRMAAGKKKRG